MIFNKHHRPPRLPDLGLVRTIRRRDPSPRLSRSHPIDYAVLTTLRKRVTSQFVISQFSLSESSHSVTHSCLSESDGRSGRSHERNRRTMLAFARESVPTNRRSNPIPVHYFFFLLNPTEFFICHFSSARPMNLAQRRTPFL